MGLRNAKPWTLKPKGCSDSLDGTNAFPGAMAALSNLVPNPSTVDTWVPRPAAVSLSTFAGFNTPGFVSVCLVVGDIAYGMIASARFAGKDEPFALNLKTLVFETISGVISANLPTSPPTTGDWTPPIMAVVGSRIIVTHPGFAGGAPGFFFGWLDISGFTDTTHTGTTHTSTLIDTLSANVLTAGWAPGMTISGTNIPAGTTIVSIAAGGLSLILSAAATDSVAGKALSVAGGTAAAPLWGAGNTNLNPLLAVPLSVAQMAGRAYFAVLSGVVLSDSGNALQVTNASQVLTFNNGLTVTALGPLPLSSPLTGGIVQALIAFQGVTAMQVVTGDPTTTNLTVNLAKTGTGTLAPLSIVSFTEGLAFISPEGLRVVDFFARVSNPVGDHGTGITIPFIYSISPSRICAAANADTLRVSVQNGNVSGQPMQEWWFDITRKAWHGPHTFPASIIQPWENTFLMAPSGIVASLWQSDATPQVASTYTENGASLNWDYETVLMPDTDDMKMHAMSELTIASRFPPSALITVTVLDEESSVLDTIFMTGSGAAATLWGSFIWGAALWIGGAGFMKQRAISPHEPLVFKQAFVHLTGNSLDSLIMGNLYLKYQELGYVLENTT